MHEELRTGSIYLKFPNHHINSAVNEIKFEMVKGLLSKSQTFQTLFALFVLVKEEQNTNHCWGRGKDELFFSVILVRDIEVTNETHRTLEATFQ